MLATVAGIFSLFPLLFTPAGNHAYAFHLYAAQFEPIETLIKVLYSVLWAIFIFTPLHRRVYE